MIDFDRLDEQVNLAELENNIKQAKENGGSNEDLPEGSYFGVFERFEIRSTKDGRPMFSCMFRVHGTYEGDAIVKKNANRCAFMNRVIYGTKNDGNMINSLIGWLEKFDCEFPIEFHGYKQFNGLIQDIFADIDGVEFDIEYCPDEFNSISVLQESMPF